MIQKNKAISILEYQESKKLSAKQLKELELINKSFNCDIFKLTAKGGFKASKYVGIVQIGNQTIEVLPKIFTYQDNLGVNDKNERTNIKKNLLFMLSYTKKLKLKETDISSLSKSTTLYESIIYLFAKNLIELLKKDLIRNYETKEENTNFLKGKLLMSKHLKYNLFNKAKFYSQFDEFTEDNLMNQIFKATIDKLLKFTDNNTNFKLLTECNLILEYVSLNNISYTQTQKVKFTRLNQQYEDIYNLSVLLLFGNSIELNAKNTKTYSLMFDMNKLFEEFIFEFIKKQVKADFINNIQSEKPQCSLFKEAPYFRLKPDITINCNKENKCELIIDTKYKKVKNVKSEKYGVSRDDIYQMFVYSKVYDCKNIILLYPKYESDVKQEFNSEYDFKVYIRTVDLHPVLTDKGNREKLSEKLMEELNYIKNG